MRRGTQQPRCSRFVKILQKPTTKSSRALAPAGWEKCGRGGILGPCCNDSYFLDFAAAARTAAQRFFVASIMRRRPSGLRRRFAFLGAEATASDAAPFFTAAHLLRCASAIRLRAAALIVRRTFAGITETDSELEPLNIALSCTICSL